MWFMYFPKSFNSKKYCSFCVLGLPPWAFFCLPITTYALILFLNSDTTICLCMCSMDGNSLGFSILLITWAIIFCICPPGIPNTKPCNLILVAIDNECYETTGGQPTATAGVTNLDLLAKGAGFEKVHRVATPDELRSTFEEALRTDDLHFILVKVAKGQADVPECKLDPIEITHRFRRALSPPI